MNKFISSLVTVFLSYQATASTTGFDMIPNKFKNQQMAVLPVGYQMTRGLLPLKTQKSVQEEHWNKQIQSYYAAAQTNAVINKNDSINHNASEIKKRTILKDTPCFNLHVSAPQLHKYFQYIDGRMNVISKRLNLNAKYRPDTKVPANEELIYIMITDPLKRIKNEFSSLSVSHDEGKFIALSIGDLIDKLEELMSRVSTIDHKIGITPAQAKTFGLDSSVLNDELSSYRISLEVLLQLLDPKVPLANAYHKNNQKNDLKKPNKEFRFAQDKELTKTVATTNTLEKLFDFLAKQTDKIENMLDDANNGFVFIGDPLESERKRYITAWVKRIQKEITVLTDPFTKEKYKMELKEWMDQLTKLNNVITDKTQHGIETTTLDYKALSTQVLTYQSVLKLILKDLNNSHGTA